MTKVLWQILKLLWKVFCTVIWKWLKPMLGKFAFAALVIVGLIVALVMLLGGC